MRIDKINIEIARAKERIAEWQARLRDFERQKTEQENLQILQAVRGAAASPQEIEEALTLIRASKTATHSKQQEETENET